MNASMILEFRRSKTLVLIVVTSVLLLDALMMTVVIPILPNCLEMDTTNLPQLTISKNNSIKIDSNKDPPELEVLSNSDGSARLGLLLASKPIFQIIVGPFVGTFTDKVGFSIPMIIGFVVMFISTLMFAFVKSYHLLFAARSIQGISTSLSVIPGLAMLSNSYPDNEERGNAMAKAFLGMSLGVIIGPPFGAYFYENFGKPVPFLIIAGFALVDGCLRLFISNPKLTEAVKKTKGPSFITLVKDPYIMICAGSFSFAHFGTASLEPSLPLHMKYIMNASILQQGLVFLPIGVTRLLVNTSVVRIGFLVGRYLTAIFGLFLAGICLVLISFCKNMVQLMLSTIGIGLAMAFLETSLLPLLSYLVDIRHTAVYGCAFAIADLFLCLTFCIGPTLSGFLAEEFGFQYSLWLISAIFFIYSPLLYFLKNPPAKDNKRKNIPKNYKTFEEENIMVDN